MSIWSSFGRRWAALPSASAGYTLLGLPTISAYIQTLLDDADAATARTTLDAVGLTGNETVAGIKTFSSNPVLSGGGIAFPATQVPSGGANVLDDYEEGTFTPAFSATGCTFSYSLQGGRYTKIGRLVHVGIGLTLNTSGNTLLANALSITGLPFTSAVSSSQTLYGRWVNSTTSYDTILGLINASDTTIAMAALGAPGTSYPTTVNANALLHATNATQVRINGVYEAA